MASSDHIRSSPLYLAIDQGGHASRAIVFDGTGALVTQSAVAIKTFHPAQNQVEHDPEALVRSVREAIDQVLHELGDQAARICAAGLATQRSTIVSWNRESGAALSPVISWQDRRAADWLEKFRSRAADIQERTGLVLSPHYGAGKLRWCLDHLPAVAEARQQGHLVFGPLASFLLFRLLEERPLVADPSNASRTQLWDLGTHDWSQELLDLFGLPLECLPGCVASTYGFGHLSAGNLRIPLSVVTGDQPSALYALGEPDADTLYVNMGTGAFVQRITASYPTPTSNLLRSVVLQAAAHTTYVLEGTVNGAGSALEQTGKQLGVSQAELKASLAGWLERPAEPPLFMNGVSGLGSPFWLSNFASEFVGEGEPWEKMVAVAESIVFLLQVNIEQISHTGRSPQRIIVSGGLADLAGLVQRLADISGLPVMRLPLQEATAAGLAYLISRPEHQPWNQCAFMAAKPKANQTLQKRYVNWRRELEARIDNGGSLRY